MTITKEKMIVHGGNKLSGHVTISGSKNSALALLAASLCCNGATTFRNVPVLLSDIEAMIAILRSLGAQVDHIKAKGVNNYSDMLVVDANGVSPGEPVPGSVSMIRGSIFVLGPLIGRFGEAVVALPGGCDIGARPVDLYVRGLRALGASVEIREGKVVAKCVNGKRLKGGNFHLSYPSVGATETLVMAASLADGVTTLSNVAQEPEVDDLVHYLIKCGADIEGGGTNILIIRGKDRLHGCDHVIMPDRIEAGTFAIAAAISRSCFSISPVIPNHLESLLHVLESAGCTIIRSSHDTIQISGTRVPTGPDFHLQGVIHVKTGPYPKFPTDLQPQIMAFLSTCSGSSIVEETVFENRLGHVMELHKLGANIQVSGDSAVVLGGSKLRGSRVMAKDLRGGAALVLAGLAASGTTEIDGVYHIDRGYEDLQGKLQSLGAKVIRSSSFGHRKSSIVLNSLALEEQL